MVRKNKLPFNDVFTKVPESLWFPLVLVGAPPKDQAPSCLTPQIAHRPSPCAARSLPSLS